MGKPKRFTKEELRVHRAAYYQKNKAKCRELNRAWRAAHPKKMQEYRERWYAKHLGSKLECCRIYREKLRERALTAYGNKCRCCGEQEPKFLSFDHVNNDGAKHRKEVGRSGNMLRWLRDNNWPDIVQILCHNCNQAKGAYGICPHTQARNLQGMSAV